MQKQFTDGDIPVQYHFNMLQDPDRVGGFKAAIDRTVRPGTKVVELGGGTGLLSWFAAQHASKVWCVERNGELADLARKLLDTNRHGDRVEIIRCDAREFVPPEPVDVVICEMLHVALVFEQQVNVIDAFKRRYVERHGDKLPVFIPEASVLMVQPVNQSFDFAGFNAPVPMFQYPVPQHDRTKDLAEPAIYSALCYDESLPQRFQIDQPFVMGCDAQINAVRLATRNALRIDCREGSSIDWWNQHLVLPTSEPLDVHCGDVIRIQSEYEAGATLQQLEASIEVAVQSLAFDTQAKKASSQSEQKNMQGSRKKAA